MPSLDLIGDVVGGALPATRVVRRFVLVLEVDGLARPGLETDAKFGGPGGTGSHRRLTRTRPDPDDDLAHGHRAIDHLDQKLRIVFVRRADEEFLLCG